MRSDRLSETAQDAYTLVLEMSRPGPNIQIAARSSRASASSLAACPQLSDLVGASFRMRQACALSLKDVDTTFILEACPREFPACGSPAFWQTGRRSWLFPLMPPPPCR